MIPIDAETPVAALLQLAALHTHICPEAPEYSCRSSHSLVSLPSAAQSRMMTRFPSRVGNWEGNIGGGKIISNNGCEAVCCTFALNNEVGSNVCW